MSYAKGYETGMHDAWEDKDRYASYEPLMDPVWLSGYEAGYADHVT